MFEANKKCHRGEEGEGGEEQNSSVYGLNLG